MTCMNSNTALRESMDVCHRFCQYGVVLVLKRFATISSVVVYLKFIAISFASFSSFARSVVFVLYHSWSTELFTAFGGASFGSRFLHCPLLLYNFTWIEALLFLKEIHRDYLQAFRFFPPLSSFPFVSYHSFDQSNHLPQLVESSFNSFF